MSARCTPPPETVAENRLAGKLAGMLFAAASLSAPSLLFLPGGVTEHWPWVAAMAVACLTWAGACLFLIDFAQAGRAVFLIPAVGALASTAIVMAATGGSSSPARFYVIFVLVYAALFFSPREAYPFLAGCVLVHASPLLYDSGDQYVGELLVMSCAYVLLGLLLVRAKRLLLDLRAEAHSLALKDPLTGLPNRRAMLLWLERALDPAQELGPVGVLLVDLDGFKDVNTVHGYPEGDRVLCDTAEILERCVRSDDMVARLGGDEFAVLALRADEAGMRRLCERVLEGTRGIQLGAGASEVRLTASVGWVMHPHDGDSIDELIAAADVCMRGAKATGKDRALSAIDWMPVAAPAGV